MFTATLLLTAGSMTLQAQSIMVSFTGTGAASTVDSVKVENLSQCKSLTLAGTDTLLLAQDVGIIETGYRNDLSVSVQPNPSSGPVLLSVISPRLQQAVISLYDLSGRTILEQDALLAEGSSSFLLTNAGSGIYLLRVTAGDAIATVKLIFTAGRNGKPYLKEEGVISGIRTNSALVSSGTTALVFMQYNMGDTLKLTGKSGIFRTVSMLFPDHSQTVTFTFVECTDADSNHYAVVQIGSQLWMQENLKTTKYRDGSDIPNVPDSATWGNLTTGAYCDYHNLPAEGAYYGHLYNFYAVDDSRKICPAGWHVPSNGEWNVLDKFLDSTVDTTALAGTGRVIGRILKEGCSTRWAYMDTTYGLNSAGFTALCANFRTATGSWSLAPDNNHDAGFWTATSFSTSSAWFRSLRWCYSDIYQLYSFKRGGNSLRCVHD
jgi:uncharacterized protein (TIGR02145 family)